MLVEIFFYRAVSYQLSAISNQQSAISGQQSAVSNQQSAAPNLLPVSSVLRERGLLQRVTIETRDTGFGTWDQGTETRYQVLGTSGQISLSFWTKWRICSIIVERSDPDEIRLCLKIYDFISPSWNKNTDFIGQVGQADSSLRIGMTGLIG